MRATAAATTTLVVDSPGVREHPVAEALLTFKLRHYKPSAPPAPDHERAPAGPASIKDAIIRWLDEQL